MREAWLCSDRVESRSARRYRVQWYYGRSARRGFEGNVGASWRTSSPRSGIGSALLLGEGQRSGRWLPFGTWRRLVRPAWAGAAISLGTAGRGGEQYYSYVSTVLHYAGRRRSVLRTCTRGVRSLAVCTCGAVLCLCKSLSYAPGQSAQGQRLVSAFVCASKPTLRIQYNPQLLVKIQDS